MIDWSDGETPPREQDGADALRAARCSHCGHPFADDEPQIVLMRDGAVAAVYHERCHPHYRRSGCSRC